MSLYLITNEIDCPCTNSLLAKCEAALQGGVDWIQYRTKSRAYAQAIRQAQALHKLCQQYPDSRLFINDSLELALQLQTHLHLGQNDIALKQARQQLPEQLIGVTCHDQLALAQQAITDGADYVSFGAFFSSVTKPAARPAPLDILSQARKQLPCSTTIVAIGGISLKTAAQLYKAGADRLALSHGILGSTHIKKTCQQLLKAR